MCDTEEGENAERRKQWERRRKNGLGKDSALTNMSKVHTVAMFMKTSKWNWLFLHKLEDLI